MAEEGTVTAVVLDHEQMHQKSRSWHRDNEAQPVAQIESRPHQDPQQNKRRGSDQELEHAAGEAWLSIAVENLHPVARA